MKKKNYKKLDGKTKNLVDQVNKLFRSDNQKSIKTRYRYLAAQERFCKWLAQNTNIKKIKNIKARHFIKYAEHLKNQDLSSKMIKSELSGIRHFHNLTGSKEILPTNQRLNIQKIVTNGGVNRSWSQKEVKNALELARKMGRIDVIMAINLSYTFGTRLEETITLTNKQIESAIKNKQLDLTNTKGARPRGVRVREESKYKDMQLRALQFCKENALSKDKVFVGVGQPTHKIIKSIQNWVYNNRTKFQNNDIRINRGEARKIATYNRDNKLDIERPHSELTFHGLRHSFANNLYKEILQEKEKEHSKERKYDKEKEHIKEYEREKVLERIKEHENEHKEPQHNKEREIREKGREQEIEKTRDNEKEHEHTRENTEKIVEKEHISEITREDKEEAEEETSKELGHDRPKVSKTYINLD